MPDNAVSVTMKLTTMMHVAAQNSAVSFVGGTAAPGVLMVTCATTVADLQTIKIYNR